MYLLTKEIGRYYPTIKDPRTRKKWIRDPFANKTGKYNMSKLEEEQIIEFANDARFKSTFEKTTLPVFWIKIRIGVH